MDQIYKDCTTILLRQPWEKLVPWERTPSHRSKQVKFRPSWLFDKGFLCTADKLQCWPMLARKGTYWCVFAFSFLHLSFIGRIASVVLSKSWYQVLSFEKDPWAGFGRILAVACQTTEKHWCLQRRASVGRLSQANLHKSHSAKTMMWTHRSNLDYIAILLRQPWEDLVLWERTPWHWSKHLKFRPSWLFHKGCLSLQSWQTAMLAHAGTLTSTYWAFSFQSAFI